MRGDKINKGGGEILPYNTVDGGVDSNGPELVRGGNREDFGNQGDVRRGEGWGKTSQGGCSSEEVGKPRGEDRKVMFADGVGDSVRSSRRMGEG